MPLDPQAHTLLEQLAAVGGPELHEQTPEEARQTFLAFAALAGEGEPVAKVESRGVGTSDVPIRIYWPAGDGPFPVVMFFHGGGWVIGDVNTHDPTCRALANAVGAVVINVDYRLAPEHPAPAAAEDCYAATAWAYANAASLGGDPERLAVAGDSAGGNLAAATCLLARERGGPPIRFQLLVYPAVDATMEHPSIKENGEGYLLTAEALAWFWGHYVGTSDTKDPVISPLHAADLSGLPPALVITAEFDPLRDEGEAYAARLRQSGVPATSSRYDGMVHGFVGITMFDACGKALAEAATALKEALRA